MGNRSPVVAALFGRLGGSVARGLHLLDFGFFGFALGFAALFLSLRLAEKRGLIQLLA